MPALPEDTSEQIRLLCADGDDLADEEDYPAALAKFSAAWDLLPAPQTGWNAATWILSAIGDVNFLNGDFAAGRDNLAKAMQCPNALGNPFLHLRLGQCQFELENLDRAADELTRAYMGDGTDIFNDEDPKYWAFLTTRIDPPAGGW